MLIAIALLLTLARLPLRMLYTLATFLAFCMRVCSYRKTVTEENLRLCFPEKSENELRELRNAYYLNLADVLVETAKSFHMSKKELTRRVHFCNPEMLSEKVKGGQTVITLSSHQCNWEWQLLASSMLGIPVDAAYKKLRNYTAEELMLRMRGQYGAQMVESKRFLRSCLKRHEMTRAIAMVGDQRPGAASSEEIDFLNRRTRFFTGAEMLARHFDYPILFLEMVRVKRGYYEITFKEIASPPYADSFSITAQYAQLLQESIRKYPANWLWSHKRWKEIN